MTTLTNEDERIVKADVTHGQGMVSVLVEMHECLGGTGGEWIARRFRLRGDEVRALAALVEE